MLCIMISVKAAISAKSLKRCHSFPSCLNSSSSQPSNPGWKCTDTVYLWLQITVGEQKIILCTLKRTSFFIWLLLSTVPWHTATHAVLLYTWTWQDKWKWQSQLCRATTGQARRTGGCKLPSAWPCHPQLGVEPTRLHKHTHTHTHSNKAEGQAENTTAVAPVTVKRNVTCIFICCSLCIISIISSFSPLSTFFAFAP